MKKAMALLLACSMVLAFAACSKKQYTDREVEVTDQEVTAVVDVTDENGKTVTNKDGKAQTRVVTVPLTTADGNTVAVGESTSGGSNTTAKGDKTGTTAKSGKDKTEKTSKKKETTTKKTTTTTTVAANRKIHITVSLPPGLDTRRDKMRIFINGKQVDEKEVTLGIGNTFTYTTEKKYLGDVKVQRELEHTKKSETKTVKKGKDTATFSWEGIEQMQGDDD